MNVDTALAVVKEKHYLFHKATLILQTSPRILYMLLCLVPKRKFILHPTPPVSSLG